MNISGVLAIVTAFALLPICVFSGASAADRSAAGSFEQRTASLFTPVPSAAARPKTNFLKKAAEVVCVASEEGKKCDSGGVCKCYNFDPQTKICYCKE